MNRGKKKILIFIISYKASFRVLQVYQKIPFKHLKNFFVKVLISDDFSNDDTINYIKRIDNDNNVYTNENKNNLGYGAHIKKCLNFAIKNKFDYAIMIHGDGQYSPKYIPAMLKVFKKNVAELMLYRFGILT
jgi:GT2 family glycosyltransferase